MDGWALALPAWKIFSCAGGLLLSMLAAMAMDGWAGVDGRAGVGSGAAAAGAAAATITSSMEYRNKSFMLAVASQSVRQLAMNQRTAGPAWNKSSMLTVAMVIQILEARGGNLYSKHRKVNKANLNKQTNIHNSKLESISKARQIYFKFQKSVEKTNLNQTI